MSTPVYFIWEFLHTLRPICQISFWQLTLIYQKTTKPRYIPRAHVLLNQQLRNDMLMVIQKPEPGISVWLCIYLIGCCAQYAYMHIVHSSQSGLAVFLAGFQCNLEVLIPWYCPKGSRTLGIRLKITQRTLTRIKGVLQIKTSDPKFGSWCINGAGESLSRVDSLVPMITDHWS